MTTFENRSTGTTYDDRDNQADRGGRQEWDSHQDRDGHPQHAGLPMAGNMMCMWTVASYDYALQVLKAQQQFTHSMLAAAAPMLNVVRGITSTDSDEDRPANNRLGARGDQRHERYEDSRGSRKNERYNDDDSAEYDKRLVDNNRSDDSTSDTSRTQRGNTQTEESAKTRARVTSNTADRKHS
jgi:hypothetical protein